MSFSKRQWVFRKNSSLTLNFRCKNACFFCSLSEQLKGQHIFRKGLCVFRKGQFQFQKLKRSPPPTKSRFGLLDHAGDSMLDLAGPMKRKEKKDKEERKEEEKREKKEGES